MAKVTVPRTKLFGTHIERWAGNDLDVVSPAFMHAAESINEIVGRHPKVLLTLSVQSLSGSASTVDHFRGTFRTSLCGESLSGGNVQVKVRCSMVILTADNTGASLDPRVQWSLAKTGGGTTTQAEVYVSRRSSSAGALVPNDYTLVEQTWTLDGDSEYTATCSLYDYARVLSVCVYEEPRKKLYLNPTSPGSDYAVSPQEFAATSPIRDRGIDDLQDTIYTVWKKYGSIIGHYDDVLGAFSSTNTALRNMFSSGFSDWDAKAPGFHFRTEYKGTFDSNSIPVIVRIRAKVTTGTGTIRVRTAAGTDLGTISVTSTSYAYHSVTVNLSSASTTQKIDLLWNAPAAGTISVTNATAYEYAT